MKLIINPNTQEGQTQLEAIGWAQDQMNQVLLNFFNNKPKLVKGIKLEFRVGLDLDLSNMVKIDIYDLSPKDEKEFDADAIEAKRDLLVTLKTQHGSNKK